MTYVLLGAIIVFQMLILCMTMYVKNIVLSNNLLNCRIMAMLERVKNISITVLEEQYENNEKK